MHEKIAVLHLNDNTVRLKQENIGIFAMNGVTKSAVSMPQSVLSGTVERITFHNEENGFCVFKVAVRGYDDLVTIVGTVIQVGPGECVECQGQWIADRQYGRQFKAESVRVIPPATAEGMEKYLASGMVKGIGAHFAKKLVKAFGEDVFDVIERHPERLQELSGIGKKRQMGLVAAWDDQKVVRDIMVFLQSHGLGTARASRIYKAYGDQSIDLILQNPYRLAADIRGIGFAIADTLAQRLGLAPDSPVRVQAGLRYCLQNFASKGHCAVVRSELLAAVIKQLDVATEHVDAALLCAQKADEVILEEINGQTCVYLASLHAIEQECAQHVRRIGNGVSSCANLDVSACIQWIESHGDIKLSSKQSVALSEILPQKLAIITGGPGVGKTTIVNSVLRIVRREGARVALCAPTGRAAKRLAESTGYPAKTVHRLLEFDAITFGFKRNMDNPLEADYLVIDECSMLDVILTNQLFRAVSNNCVVIMVGDVDQLPSVGPGAVLGDLIDSGRICVVTLTEIFRQAVGSRIIVNAHRINQGQMPLKHEPGEHQADFYLMSCDDVEEIGEKLITVVSERIPKRFGLHPVRDIQVLTPMNRASLGTIALNQRLQKVLNPNPTQAIQRYGVQYLLGDKVIQTRNNYDKEVFNGDIGLIQDIDKERGVVTVAFDQILAEYELDELDELQLAYATTIHKSQGSEYKAIVVVFAMQHYMLLQRNLLYTAATRGKQLVVLIAETKAIAMAVHQNPSGGRLTALSERIAGCYGDTCSG